MKIKNKRYWRFLMLTLAVNFFAAPSIADQPALLASLDRNYAISGTLKQNMRQAIEHLNKRLNIHPNDHEASLIKSLVHLKSGRLDAALKELDVLTRRAPEFHLAHLVRGDLLLSRVKAVAGIGYAGVFENLNKDKQQNLQRLREEAYYRLRAHINENTQRRLPRQILSLGRSVKNALLVDKSNHRLYIFERQQQHGAPKLVRDYYVSTGKVQGDKFIRGDLRTPEGVYFVTSWIPKEKLPDKYGVGAFPVNYPNELDRHLGKTGDGIWLHGTDSKYYSRPPLDSEGCVVLSNVDLDVIKKEITPGITPVVITEEVTWLDEATWLQQREKILAALERWRADWESMDVNRYLSHYAGDFWTQKHNLQSWSKRKRYLVKYKTYQKVDFSDISLFAYPDAAAKKRDIVVARFHQFYQSNNFNSNMQKRVYMSRNQDRWQIVYEGR